VGIGLAAGAVVHPLLGAGAFLLTLAGSVLPAGRVILGLGSVSGVAAAAVFTVVLEVREGYEADFGWTDFFRPAHYLAWTGLALLAALVVTDRLRPPTEDDPGAQPGQAPGGSS
jgi:hypothetical protein